MKTSIPTQEQYEQNERAKLVAQLQAVERAPLQDRREAQADLAKTMASDPALIGERIGWLIEGCYGYGACLAAKGFLEFKGNREAGLMGLLAALEWGCPLAYTRLGWHSLSKQQKRDLSAAIAEGMKAHPAIA